MYKISDTPNLPVIWLDTYVINQMAFAQSQVDKSVEQTSLSRLYERLVAARKKGEILIFESDQLYEIEHRPELVEPSSKILTHLSQGTRTHYQHPEKMQLQIAMNAFIKNKPQDPIRWNTAFTEDPFKIRDTGGFFIRAHLPRTSEQLEERKQMYENIAQEWDLIRKDLMSRKTTEKKRYEVQLKKELLGVQDTFKNTFNATLSRHAKGQAPTMEEFLQETGIVGDPLALWSHFGGKDDIEGVYKFFGSTHYTELPYVNISSQLITREIVTGQKPRSGDIMDIHHIAAFLPYCSHMILDRAMIHNVKTLGIDREYDTKVLKLSELDAELNNLGI